MIDEKEVAAAIEQKKAETKPKKKRDCSWGLGYLVSSKEDVEKTADGPSERPMRLLAPFYAGISAAMSFCKCRYTRDKSQY